MGRVAARDGRARDDRIVALVLALLAFALAAGGWLWRADRLVYDTGQSLWRLPVPDEVVIIAIDDASIDAIGRWPWRRAVHATLLERLAQAQPRAIVLDLVLSERDPDGRADELLAAALKAASPVVMPVAWQVVPGEPLLTLLPVAPLRAAVTLGAAEAVVDADGVLRHAFVEAGPPQRPYPHVAVAALRAGAEDVHPATALENDDAQTVPGWRRQGRLLIRYAGPPGHLKRVSYVDVLRGAVPPQALRGRYLLIGMTAQGLGDTLATPVNASRHAMPGVEVLGNTLVTLRRGIAVRALPPMVGGGVSALAALTLVLCFGWVGTRAALLIALASLPLALLASLGALGLGWWWSPASFMLAAVLAYPLWSWRRLERGVAALDREIARLAAEPGVLAPDAAVQAVQPDRLAGRLAALQALGSALRSARRFLAEALAGLPTAMLVDDGGGRVLLANPLAARLFGEREAADMQGLDVARLLAEFECEPQLDWAAALAEVRGSGQALAMQARLAEQGDYVIHAHGVQMHGGVRLIIAIADVAPIKQAERARDELLAFVSHDLRAPATSIALLAELELAGGSQRDVPAVMREMQRLAQRTLALADDFVRIVQATQRPLLPEPVDPGDLIAEALADFGPQAEAAGVHLQVAQAPSAAPRLLVDRALVLRALGNLLSNAIKNSPRGGCVRVGMLAAGADGAGIAVADEGPGLEEAAMRALTLGHEGLVPRAGAGVGFGLLFVQRVAERHGGRLRVRRGQDGRGAVFELLLAPGSGKA